MHSKGVQIGFVSCVIGDPADDLHLTLARRYDATEVELVSRCVLLGATT